MLSCENGGVSDTKGNAEQNKLNPISDFGELSSIQTVIEDMERRIVEMAYRWQKADREDISHDLFGAEQAIRNAKRRLRKAGDALKSSNR